MAPILGQKKKEEPEEQDEKTEESKPKLKLILPGKGVLSEEDVKKLAGEQEQTRKEFLRLSHYDRKTNRLIEQIYKDGFVFVVKDYNTGKLDFKDEVEVNNLTYKPDNKQAERFREEEVILFPTDVTDYGTIDQLLKEVIVFIKQWWYADEYDYQLCAYYVLFTWVYDKFREVGYLHNLGDWGWGKSRWLNTVGGLCFRATDVAGNVSAPSLFHTIDYSRGTTNIDEADFTGAEMTAGILKVLTQGHEKRSIIRCDTEGGGVVSYKPFGPKNVSTQKPFTDKALDSRCMKLIAKYDEAKSKLTNLPDRFFDARQLLINKLAKSRFDRWMSTKLDETMQFRMSTYEGRLCQIMIPMLSSLSMLDAEHKLTSFMEQKNEDMIQARHDHLYRLFTTILPFIETSSILRRSPSVDELVDKYNQIYPSFTDWKLTSKVCGKWIGKNGLGLETIQKNDDKYYLVCSKEDIERLKLKYHIKSEASDSK
jgi:hypothetical protein